MVFCGLLRLTTGLQGDLKLGLLWKRLQAILQISLSGLTSIFMTGAGIDKAPPMSLQKLRLKLEEFLELPIELEVTFATGS